MSQMQNIQKYSESQKQSYAAEGGISSSHQNSRGMNNTQGMSKGRMEYGFGLSNEQSLEEQPHNPLLKNRNGPGDMARYGKNEFDNSDFSASHAGGAEPISSLD